MIPPWPFHVFYCQWLQHCGLHSSLITIVFEIEDVDECTHLPQLVRINMVEYLNAYEHTERCENYNGSSKTCSFYKWTKESLEKMLHSRHLNEFERLEHDNISEPIKQLTT